MLDVIFEEFMVEIARVKNSRVDDNKRSKMMNQTAVKLSDYFDVLKILKRIFV
ncbi:MAG: hypothetical protein R2877_04845 [Bdellovibrionota bacterium]